ncbi:hypothetical protein DL93DRAFT_1836476 [Clavulina sp. PMI_390]|nr:hypothetical protein DL93DRAFT_1836476 [Clavulina sp. PMI_390]
MNSVLDSTLSTLEDALPNIIGVCFHEDVPLHTLKTAPTDRSARKRDLQAAIADVDQTIASVRAIHDVVALMLNTLQRKKASLHHALLSPVYALPTELLQRVFSMLAVEAGGSDVVIALTNVCSSWRSAALGSGRLWGQVKVRNVSMLSELVTRSAPHQFSLELQLPLGLSRESSEPPMICLEPQAARRLSSLTLADSSILRRLEFPDSTLLSSLQTLQLNGGLSLDHDNLPSLPSAFNCISKLIIHNWDRPRCLMNNALWPNLTTIFFQNSSAVSVANVLGNMAAPRLINLSFAKMTNGFWTVGFNAIVSPPPNVRSINIVDSSHFIDTFASNFRLFPNLKSLALVRLDEERGCDWDMLVSASNAIF